MTRTITLLGLMLGLGGGLMTVGCGPQEAEVAPRTEEEIEAYKRDAYGAEAESEEQELERQASGEDL